MTAKTGYQKGITLQKGLGQALYGAFAFAVTYAVILFDALPASQMAPSMICVMAITRALHNYLKHRNA